MGAPPFPWTPAGTVRVRKVAIVYAIFSVEPSISRRPVLFGFSINWKEHIVADPAVLTGKPVVKGTRLSVDFILGLLAEGWDEKKVLENYPQLDLHDLQAIFAFASECLKDEEYVALKRARM